MVKSNFGLLGGNAHTKGINLINKTDKSHTVFADEDMINLVLRNLISNAIKFTNKAGNITLSSQQIDGQMQIYVTDTGVGISKDGIDKLFTKNINPTTLGTANEKGTGLGLLLCKEFIEKNGGVIAVKSDEGKGSTFEIKLPVSA
jgi:signal transduction histidine kinase